MSKEIIDITQIDEGGQNPRTNLFEKPLWELHFINGEKRTFTNVDSHSIKQGQFTKFKTKDERLIMVNDKNILCIEIISEEDDK